MGNLVKSANSLDTRYFTLFFGFFVIQKNTTEFLVAFRQVFFGCSATVAVLRKSNNVWKIGTGSMMIWDWGKSYTNCHVSCFCNTQISEISEISQSVRNVSTATLKNAPSPTQQKSFTAVPWLFLGGDFFESSHASWAKDTKQIVTIETDVFFSHMVCVRTYSRIPRIKTKGTRIMFCFSHLPDIEGNKWLLAFSGMLKALSLWDMIYCSRRLPI